MEAIRNGMDDRAEDDGALLRSWSFTVILRNKELGELLVNKWVIWFNSENEIISLCLCQKIWNRSKWSRFQYDAFQCFIFDSFWESQNATFLGNIALALDLHLWGYLCRSKKFNDVSSTLWLICEKSINSSSTQQERLTQVI